MAKTVDPPASPSDAPAEPQPDEIDLWSFPDAAELVSYVYRATDRVDRTTSAVQSARAYVGKILGEIDPEIIRATFGGGSYYVIVKRGRNASTSRSITIDGPARVVEPTPAPAAAPAPQTPSIDQLVELLAARDQRLVELLVAKLAPAAAPASQLGPRELIEIVREVRGLAGDAQVTSSGAALKEAMDVLGRASDFVRKQTGEGRTIGDALVESFPSMLELFDKFLSSRAAARGATAPAAGAAPVAPASSVSVNANLLGIADSLARALRRDLGAEEFADVLSAMLSDEEISGLTQMPAEAVVGILRKSGHSAPELAESRAVEFVAAVIAELGKDDGQDAGQPSA